VSGYAGGILKSNFMQHNIETSNYREGILWADENVLTVISDKEIQQGDTLVFPNHINPFFNRRKKLVKVQCESVLEERPSRGDWRDPPPFGVK